MKMINSDLILTLQGMDPDAEIRLAFQPGYPLTYQIDDVVEYGEDGGTVIYLTQGGDERYGKREIFE